MTARTSGESSELPEFPFPGTSYRGPDPVFTRLRAERPVVRVRWTGGGHAWLVTRHEDVKQVLDDTRFSRAASYAPDAPKFSGLFQAPPGMIISLDPPDHTRLRVLAEQAFSAARIEGMRPRVRELAGRLLDTLDKESDGGPVDLVEGFAAPLAMAVICELLGVPERDRDQFLTWVRQFADVSGPEELAVEGRENLGAYIAGLVAGKQAEPADDVLSALIAARDGEDRLSFEELVGLGYTLLGGGYDSSAGQISNFTLTLLEHHPDYWRRLGEHPEDVPRALEELLRTVNLTANDTSGLPRIATEDVTVAGVTIPAGDAVFLAFASANRDGTVFTDPETTDFGRTHNPHLAFGHGIHRCLGAPLARVELAVALEELTARYPDARVAVPESELLWRVGDVNHNLVSLPVHLRRSTP
ncbi:cytochrome P450 [Streptomyces shenzhenensis]|uniref:cytochrome P450 n=1 Tax=Streptomyces shenzhenensis TaxID=943815 RepID=UPI0015EFDD7E|nr:cytochrome P450 [Streptomyces shenzhenensis]